MAQQTGYLFVYFTGEDTEAGEQIYFSLSEDGLHWKDCNRCEPILISQIGEKGVRDPFIIKDVHGNGYYLIATDLRIATGKGWADSVVNGSKSLLLWTSKDLINWSEPRLIEVGIPEAGCVWAPEAIYDKKRDEYLIFFASNVKEASDVEAKQRIYCTRTKDFVNFSETTKYIERENHVIDTTIVEQDGIYYRFSKNETTKHVDMDYAEDLHGEFKPVHSEALAGLCGVEGPEIYPLQDGKWCLIVDRFATHMGYLPLITEDLASGEFRILEDSEFDMGASRKRHGGVIKLDAQAYERISRALL
ncbi:MAG: glycoside hydrolase family 43 protein [Lachnospiraceae bacterium]|nr:glycoside hydrolase family 43 protein [Lachnospiraceae bacterium]